MISRTLYGEIILGREIEVCDPPRVYEGIFMMLQKGVLSCSVVQDRLCRRSDVSLYKEKSDCRIGGSLGAQVLRNGEDAQQANRFPEPGLGGVIVELA